MNQNLFFVVPIFLGIVGFLQSALNQGPGEKHGWLLTGFVNNTTGLFLSVFLLVVAGWAGKGFTATWADWRWWYLIPGCFGIIFVCGMPYSIQMIGASRTFVFLVATQLTCSVAWDAARSGAVPPMTRITGAIFAVVGAAFTLF